MSQDHIPSRQTEGNIKTEENNNDYMPNGKITEWIKFLNPYFTLNEQTLTTLKNLIEGFFKNTHQIQHVKQSLETLVGIKDLSLQQLLDDIVKEKDLLLTSHQTTQDQTSINKEKIEKIISIFKMVKSHQTQKKQLPLSQETKEELAPSLATEGQVVVRIKTEPLPDDTIRKASIIGNNHSVVFLQQSKPNELKENVQIKHQKNDVNEGEPNVSDVKEQAPKTEVNEQRSSVVSQQSTKKVQRCKFFPDCKSSDCKYLHPTIPCTYHPNCRYGNSCIYLHPFCKYGVLCTRLGCSFLHPYVPASKQHPQPNYFAQQHRPTKPQVYRPTTLRTTIDALQKERKCKVEERK